MELLKEVAHISGKGGLYRIIKPTRAGVIVEAIDETKARAVVGANSRVSVLKEISIYTDTREGSVGLGQVLTSMFDKFGAPVVLDHKTASEPALANFLGEVLPDYDRERVYTSDIKKLITWFNILVRHLPEIFEKKEEGATAEEEKVEAAVPEVKAEAADKQS
jgi:hypothetical protein